MLATQVLLDRAGFSPGEIDGRGGPNTDRALDAYERASGSRTTDGAVTPSEAATITYTITAEDAAAPLVRAIPLDMVSKARLKRLGYTSGVEMLAERFHASPALLRRLNPGLRLRPGSQDRGSEREYRVAARGASRCRASWCGFRNRPRR